MMDPVYNALHTRSLSSYLLNYSILLIDLIFSNEFQFWLNLSKEMEIEVALKRNVGNCIKPLTEFGPNGLIYFSIEIKLIHFQIEIFALHVTMRAKFMGTLHQFRRPRAKRSTIYIYS